MANDRNFRSSYYEKMGFRNVPEKQSLENLLKEKPLNKEKIEQFCLRFTVPSMYRSLVWKILLGVVPSHLDSHDFVMAQRKQVFQDLKHALMVMRTIHNDTPVEERLLFIWLLQSGRITFEIQCNCVEDSINKIVILVSKTLLKIFDDEIEVYWMTKGLVQIIQSIWSDIPKLVEHSISILEKEDSELHKHLCSIAAFGALPLDEWIKCCFAGVLAETSLIKIWDKVVCGSSNILVFVAVVLLLTMKSGLLKCEKCDEAVKCVNIISDEMAEIIVNTAVELWQDKRLPPIKSDKIFQSQKQ